jgi:hypothetical protein
MPATRTDIHRPSAPDFDPAGYELVDVFDLGDTEPNGDNAELARIEESMLNRGYAWTSPYFDAARCGHCGAHLRYAALMSHAATNAMMFVGSTCLSERFAEMTADKFADLRTAAAAKAEATREMNRRHELAAAGLKFLASAPALLVELSYAGNGGVVDGNSFLSDIARKVFQYGDLSERQVAAAERAILQGIERATEREAERVEHPAVDAPEGRVTVTGEVVMTKWYANDFGETLKMIVRDDSGFRVFVSVPSSLMGVGIDKGSRVTLVATLTQSDDDPTFSFGKRPTKASLLA